jgi:hypothetical protein
MTPIGAAKALAFSVGAVVVIRVAFGQTPIASEQPSAWRPAPSLGYDPIIVKPILMPGASIRLVGEKPGGGPVRVNLREFRPQGEGEGYIENIRGETQGGDIDIGARDQVSVEVKRSPMVTGGGAFHIRTEGDGADVALDDSPIDTSK